MSGLEENIRNRDTSDLQNAIRMGLLSDEALPIAQSILKERGEPIPEAIPTETLEAQAQSERKASNKKAIGFLVVAAIAFGYALSVIDLKHPEESQKKVFNIFLAAAAALGVGLFNNRKP